MFKYKTQSVTNFKVSKTFKQNNIVTIIVLLYVIKNNYKFQLVLSCFVYLAKLKSN